MDDADDIVRVLVVDRHPAVLQQQLVGCRIGEAGACVEGEEHRPRRHDLTGVFDLERQDVADDVGLVRFQIARAQSPPHHHQQLVVRDAVVLGRR